jgi:iron complex transport system substrate-binding protein
MMKKIIFLFFFILFQCKDVPSTSNSNIDKNFSNNVLYAKGFSLNQYKDYSKLVIKSSWKNSKENFVYILKKKNIILSDSLKKHTIIEVPIQKIVVTSTTHIPALEMLEVLPTLKGFSGLYYISSEKTRDLIDAKKVVEVGENNQLNTEVLLSLNPDLIMSFGIHGSNKSLDNLQRNGLKVIYNGDWLEENPLGKAEWIKVFGVLFDKNKKADSIFKNIEKNYNTSKEIALKTAQKPTIISGAMYQNVWYSPAGNSWMAYFFKDANANYLYADTTQEGSLSLPFETVLKEGKNADFWIGTSQFISYQEMLKANENYKYFKSFQNKRLFTSSLKKGKTGGVIFYELASSRPDLVLKDLVYILHQSPKDHKLVFFDPLND